MGYNTMACSSLVYWGWCLHRLIGSSSHSLYNFNHWGPNYDNHYNLLERLFAPDTIIAMNNNHSNIYIPHLLVTISETSVSQLALNPFGEMMFAKMLY
jgi:hypothetical protein